MSMKYELSIWRDYPGSTGIREEKIAILATTGMDFAGRAQNIKLKREYTGKITLEFEIPVKYMDPFSGEFVKNPLCSQVMEKSKLKLWRDELWWNPFGGTESYNEKTNCMEYEGAWEQGRWYDLVVHSHKEKRSKKQLFYSYTCDDLFVNELSRNGYSLQFIPNTDVMSANGMGTAHDLAERIAEGTDWKYIKTEVFPDYKEEFNAVTGETVKTPVSTDQIEFAKGLERYCFCYKLDAPNTEQEIILASIQEQLVNQGIENNIIEGTHYGFTNNKFWWKDINDTNRKNYTLGHIKTDISFNGADSIIAMDSGGMRYYTKTEGDITDDNSSAPTGATSFSEGMSLWTSENGSISYESTSDTDGTNFRSYLKLSAGGTMVFKQAAEKPLSQGSLYCAKIVTSEGFATRFQIKDNLGDKQNSVFNIVMETKPLNHNAYELTYWFTIPNYISQPYFYITNENTNELTFEAIYVYELKGSNKEINQQILELRSKKSNTFGLMDRLLCDASNPTIASPYTKSQVDRNIITSDDTSQTPIWLGFGKTTIEGYQKETYIYLIEYEINGKYYQIYLPINNNKNVALIKISSYNTDKRRQIKGEKSNRFSLIETVAKTFNCFTRFIVEHDSQGRIKLSGGRPIKRFTFVSELGRKNFNGFNYGVNLESIERTVDANNLVTKCHIENISNQYSDSNMVTIQQSKYNKLGMTYVYNFSYYLRRGLLDKTKFLKDYQKFVEDINRLTQANLTKIENEGGIITQKVNLETDISTYELLIESYKSTVAESLSTIGWERFINGEENKEGHGIVGYEEYTKFPNIKIDFLKQYKENESDIAYCYYEDDLVLQGYSEGKYKVPNGFHTVDNLAQYIAYNIVGSVNGDGSPPWVPTTDSEFWGKGLSKDTIFIELNRIFSTQENYNKTQAKLTQALEQLEKLKIQVDEYNSVLDTNNKEIQRKVKSFERKYSDYIIEGQWKGNDYIDADAYYLDATRAMAVSCMPKVSYNIGAVDLSQLSNPFNPEDTDWGKEFIYNVGDTSYVKDEELFGNTEQLTMIATITSYVDIDKQDNIEMRNYETRFEELFQQISAAVTSVQFNENIWSKAAGFTDDGGIDETILQNAFNNNKNLIIASANNMVTQDNKGITVKDNDTGKVLRLVGGGLFLSSDGGNTYKTGFTPEGMNASLITVGQLDTSKIVIRSSNTPTFELTDQGLTAFSSIAQSRITRFDQFGIYSSDKAERFTKDWWKTSTIEVPEDYIISNSIFSLTRLGLNFKYEKGGLTFGTIGDNIYGLLVKDTDGNETIRIDNNGNAKFTGHIVATQLTLVGDVELPEINLDGVVKIDTPISSKDNSFNVSSAGLLTAVNANITGTIYANYGRIGGWTITDDYLDSYGPNGERLFLSAGTSSDYWIGAHNGSGSYGFLLSKEGILTANGAVIEGKITANSGKIANWDISGSDGYILNQFTSSEGIFRQIWMRATSQDGASAFAVYANGDPQFYVTNAGYLYAKDAHIEGELLSGTILLDGVKIGTSALTEFLDYGETGTTWRLNNNLNIGIDMFNGYLYLRNTSTKIYMNSNYGDLIGTWTYNTYPISTSDMNKKNTINNLESRYSKFFDELCPVTFKYNDGTSDRLHLGFIAQDVKKALDSSGINTKNFGGFVVLNPNTEDEYLGLRYEEFIALNTSEIQKLKARVAELEAKVASLTSI